jgi:hypothetical protein
MLAYDKDRFLLGNIDDARFEFRRDPSGRVVELAGTFLRQPGFNASRGVR